MSEPRMRARARYRILQITANPFPPEIRVVKEGLSLLDAGYHSAVMCPLIAGRPERENWRGIEVFRPAELARTRSNSDRLLYQAAFFSPAWARAIRKVLAEYRPNVIHVHDIWLGRTVFHAKGPELVVMDLHENMPAAVVEYQKGYRGAFKLFNAFFKSHARVMRYEGALLRKSDLVLVVVEEALHRVRDDNPALPPNKVVNIENLESKNFVNETAAPGQLFAPDHFSILYIGGFGPHRGIDTLIRAMRHVKEWGLDVRVHLVGARESVYLQMLRELVRELAVEEYVTITGWVPAESVLAYIRQASVGAVPHHSNPHTDNTIPHKLFQYMIASTPVFVSTSPPLARTVRSARAGVVFEAGNDLDCAVKIRAMVEDPKLLQNCGRNGFDYVMRAGHNWEEESAPKLIATYDRLLGVSHVPVAEPMQSPP